MWRGGATVKEVFSQKGHVFEEDFETSVSSTSFLILFPSHPEVGSFARPHTPHHDVLLYHRPKSNSANNID